MARGRRCPYRGSMLLASWPGPPRAADPRRTPPRRARLVAALVAGLVLAMALAPTAHAALAWRLTTTPTTVTAGTTTTFSLTAENLLSLTPIRCIEVEVDRILDVVSASASAGWTAAIVGGSGNRVRVSSDSSAGIGLLGSTTFAIKATAVTPGQGPWPADAYSRSDCGGSGGLIGTYPTVRVVAGPTPSPTASLTPSVPPSSPTPAPTIPLPAPTLPLPTLTPPPGPGDSPGPVPSGAPPAAGAGSGATGSRPSVKIALPAGVDGARFGAELGAFGVLDDPIVWLIPAATLGAPGLLILLWVALQATGALAWLPAVRRLRRGGPAAA